MILISEMLSMPEFKEFRLLTGKNGTDKRISNIGIHDYESLEQISKTFGKGDFVLTTLFACKDDALMAEEYICALLDAGVSGIAIKEVFYKELSEACIVKAEEKKIPLMFYPKHIYVEDIIVKIKNLLNEKKYNETLENTIKSIIDGTISSEEETYFKSKTNPSNLPNIAVVYVQQKNINANKMKSDVKNVKKAISALPSNNDVFLTEYDNGIMGFISYEHKIKGENNLEMCLNSLGNMTEYYIGYEIENAKKRNLRQTIKNAITAARVCKYEKENKMSFEDIGVYKMILPEKNNLGLIKYSNEIISKIKKYDIKYNSSLFTTAEKYIDNNGDVGRTAEDLHQHANTIRYRISKMKELLGYEKKSNDSFYVELYLTMKVSKLGMIEFIKRSI